MNIERHFINVSHSTLVDIAVDYAKEINILEVRLKEAQQRANLHSEYRDRANRRHKEAKVRVKQLESYLDKTSDSTDEKPILVADCEKLYCPECAEEVCNLSLSIPAMYMCFVCHPEGLTLTNNPIMATDCYSTPGGK